MFKVLQTNLSTLIVHLSLKMRYSKSKIINVTPNKKLENCQNRETNLYNTHSVFTLNVVQQMYFPLINKLEKKPKTILAGKQAINKSTSNVVLIQRVKHIKEFFFRNNMISNKTREFT